MPYPISDKVLQEILRAFAWEEASMPSENALRELESRFRSNSFITRVPEIVASFAGS